MSDDDDMAFMSDDDYAFEDDEEMEEIRRQAEVQRQERARRPPAPAPRRAQPPPIQPPPALGGMFGSGQGGMFGGLGGMMAAAAQGFGGAGFGMGMHTSATAFRQTYVAYSTSIHEAAEGRMDRISGGRQNVMFGGNVLMPPDALDLLTRLEIEGPWTFELINPHDQSKHTHCGVLEFTAPANTVYLPQWMMTQLGFSEGSQVRINGAALPKGKFVKLQPQEVTFLELSDPKAVLERALPNFTCLTKGDIIEISHQHIQLSFLIMETKPDAEGINILNTDIEVDFAPPVGYVEPDYKAKAPASTMASKMGINVDQKVENSKAASQAGPSFSAFVGTGQSLGGKRIKGKGTKGRQIEEVDADSRIERTDRQKFINANAMPDNRTVPAALNLPFGHLFFGYTHVPLTSGATSDLAKAEGSKPAPSFQGQGATLSGRRRPNNAQSSEISSARPTKSAEGGPDAQEKLVPFQGQGHSLQASAPKKAAREVIEID